MDQEKRTRQKNRKTATRLLLINWSRFQNIIVRLEGSTLFTGVNGSGKSTILDAMTYLLTGNTQFNKARRTEIGQLRHMYAEIRKATERTAI